MDSAFSWVFSFCKHAHLISLRVCWGITHLLPQSKCWQPRLISNGRKQLKSLKWSCVDSELITNPNATASSWQKNHQTLHGLKLGSLHVASQLSASGPSGMRFVSQPVESGLTREHRFVMTALLICSARLKSLEHMAPGKCCSKRTLKGPSIRPIESAYIQMDTLHLWRLLEWLVTASHTWWYHSRSPLMASEGSISVLFSLV